MQVDLHKDRAKIICLSATTNNNINKMTARYLGINSPYETIGDANTYAFPNVAILLKRSRESQLINDVINHVRGVFSQISNRPSIAVHLITQTREQAMDISNRLNRYGISSTWLTSECSESQRSLAMDTWDAGKLNVLASTFDCGIDCGITKQTINVGGCRSVVQAVQSIGRIRPRNKMEDKRSLYFG